MTDWPKHPNGRNLKFGELSPAQQRAVTAKAATTLRAELNDPKHPTRRTIEAILDGSVTVTRTPQH